jgi:hypothetical protein
MVSMIDELELKGQWWLPEKPGDKVTGTLRFNQEEGLILELIGTLDELKSGPVSARWDADIILGWPTKGNPVTLYRCSQKAKTFNAPGMITQIIRADFMFWGSHFNGPDKLKFRSATVRFSHFDEWLGISGFEVSYIPSEKRTQIEYRRPDPVELFTFEAYKARIQFTSTIPIGARHELKMNQAAFLKIEAEDGPKDFLDWLELIRCLQDFLTLATLNPSYPLSISCRSDELDTGEAAKRSTDPVIVYYSLPFRPDKTIKVLDREMLFTYDRMSRVSNSIFNKWIEKSEKLKPVFDYFFSTIYAQKLYLEHRFLNLVMALEFYHRRTRKAKYQTDDEFRSGTYPRLVEAIPKELPADFSSSLESRMAWLNEYSLRKRIIDILASYKDVVSSRIDDPKQFAKDVADSRNNIIHQDESVKEQYSASGLYSYCEKLRLILVACFLSEIGLPPDQIEAIISDHKRLSLA